MIIFQPSNVYLTVRFAQTSQSIHTLEGEVEARRGDAIVEGIQGEMWPIARKDFLKKYEPVLGTLSGEEGRYKKRLAFVEATQLVDTETIALSDERGVLTGQNGDWHLSYGLGNHSFIRADILAGTYEPSKSILARIGVEPALFESRMIDLKLMESELRQALPHTPIFLTSLYARDDASEFFWLKVSDTPSSDELAVILTSEQFLKTGPGSLLTELTFLREQSVATFTAGSIRTLVQSLFLKPQGASDVQLVAMQLQALDEFNAALQCHDDNEFFIDKAPDELNTYAKNDFRRVGGAADTLAADAQMQWHELVLANTKIIAMVRQKKWFARPWSTGSLFWGKSIATFGLLAALGLAGFSELGDGCHANDSLVWIGCNTQGWKQWLGDGAFLIYLAALALAWWRYAAGKVNRIESKHQDYRLIAECLRAQYVRSAMGFEESAEDRLPIAENSESSWVLLALRSLMSENQSFEPIGNHVEAANRWAMQAFVEEQRKYNVNTFVKRREDAAAVLSAAAHWGSGLFFICLVLLTIQVASRFIQPETVLFSPMGQHVLLIAQVAGLAVWATMRKVIDTLALEQEIQRGKIVLGALMKATESDSQSIIEAVRFFARDQAVWHALRRSKPVEATTGGG